MKAKLLTRIERQDLLRTTTVWKFDGKEYKTYNAAFKAAVKKYGLNAAINICVPKSWTS